MTTAASVYVVLVGQGVSTFGWDDVLEVLSGVTDPPIEESYMCGEENV